jgi:hypothetical protein
MQYIRYDTDCARQRRFTQTSTAWDRRLSPRLNWILPSFRLLRDKRRFETNVSGLPIGPIFEGKALQVSRLITQKTGDFSVSTASVWTSAEEEDLLFFSCDVREQYFEEVTKDVLGSPLLQQNWWNGQFCGSQWSRLEHWKIYRLFSTRERRKGLDLACLE